MSGPDVQMRQEVRTFSSRYLDQTLMYPGKWVLTHVKLPNMPWTLVSMEPYEEDNETGPRRPA